MLNRSIGTSLLAVAVVLASDANATPVGVAVGFTSKATLAINVTGGMSQVTTNQWLLTASNPSPLTTFTAGVSTYELPPPPFTPKVSQSMFEYAALTEISVGVNIDVGQGTLELGGTVHEGRYDGDEFDGSAPAPVLLTIANETYELYAPGPAQLLPNETLDDVLEDLFIGNLVLSDGTALVDPFGNVLQMNFTATFTQIDVSYIESLLGVTGGQLSFLAGASASATLTAIDEPPALALLVFGLLLLHRPRHRRQGLSAADPHRRGHPRGLAAGVERCRSISTRGSSEPAYTRGAVS